MFCLGPLTPTELNGHLLKINFNWFINCRLLQLNRSAPDIDISAIKRQLCIFKHYLICCHASLKIKIYQSGHRVVDSLHLFVPQYLQHDLSKHFCFGLFFFNPALRKYCMLQGNSKYRGLEKCFITQRIDVSSFFGCYVSLSEAKMCKLSVKCFGRLLYFVYWEWYHQPRDGVSWIIS